MTAIYFSLSSEKCTYVSPFGYRRLLNALNINVNVVWPCRRASLSSALYVCDTSASFLWRRHSVWRDGDPVNQPHFPLSEATRQRLCVCVFIHLTLQLAPGNKNYEYVGKFHTSYLTLFARVFMRP